MLFLFNVATVAPFLGIYSTIPCAASSLIASLIGALLIFISVAIVCSIIFSPDLSSPVAMAVIIEFITSTYKFVFVIGLKVPIFLSVLIYYNNIIL